MKRVREGKRQHRQRARIYRVLVAGGGILLVLGGLLLSLPGVPGPGLVVMAIGFGLLALEFDSAERVLDWILERIEDAGEKAASASRTQKVLTGAAVALAAAAAVAAAVLLDLPFVPL